MKKFVALFLVLILVLFSVSALAVTPAELLGTWYTGETTYSGDTYLLTGDYSVEFKRDSTATVVLNGQSKEYTWKATDYGASLAADDTKYDFSLDYENDKLTGSIPDFTIEERYSYEFSFSREKPELFTVPAVITAETEESYFGDWKIDFTVSPKGVLKTGEKYSNISLKVEFAQISLTKDESDVRYALTDFVDGKLKFKASDLDLGEGTGIVELVENGYAKVTLEDVPEETFNYYLVKADAAGE